MSDQKPTGAAALRELYHRTGLPFMECKRLLAAADGDFEKAMELRFTLPPEPVPPKYACPECGQTLGVADHSECPRCRWLRFPGDRSRWATAGTCPQCKFDYRWDGSHCSHCGFGTTEDGRAAAS